MESKSKRVYRSIGKELTKSELKILTLISFGYSDAEIANKIGEEKKNIVGKRRVIKLKMGGKNTAHSIRIAFETGVLP